MATCTFLPCQIAAPSCLAPRLILLDFYCRLILVNMTEYEPPVQPGYLNQKRLGIYDIAILPSWARCETQYAQNLLESSNEPIEYDHDEDYRDNCFFFPEDCSWSPPKNWVLETESENVPHITDGCYEPCDDTMVPGLPDIKMLDADALSDLLEDNLSPPEITSILYGPCATSMPLLTS